MTETLLLAILKDGLILEVAAHSNWG